MNPLQNLIYSRHFFWFCWSLVFVIGLFFAVSRWNFTVDDAWITLRYARNAVDGFGIVFNREGARIEGFSNPLFLLFGILFLKLNIQPMIGLKIVLLFASIASLLATYRLARTVGGDKWSSMAAMAFAGWASPVAYWALSGLETIFFMAAVTAAFGTLLHPQVTFRVALLGGVFLAIAAVTRIEGPMYTMLTGLGCAMYYARTRKMPTHAWSLVPALLLCAVLYGWRFNYYGAFLPNTYACKAHGQPWAVVGPFIQTYWPILLLGAAGILKWDWQEWLLGVSIATHLLLYRTASMAVSEYHRHFVVLLPLMAALVIGVAAKLPQSLGSTLVLCLLVLGTLLPLTNIEKYQLFKDHKPRELARIKVAGFLNQQSAPTDEVAVGDVGAIGYFMDLPIVDIYCLTDELYAPRFKGDAYRFAMHLTAERKPRWLVLLSSETDRLVPKWPQDKIIAKTSGMRNYELRKVIGDGGYQWHIFELKASARVGDATMELNEAPCDCAG